MKRPPLRLLSLTLVAAALTGCASDNSAPPPLTPLDQYPLAAQSRIDAIHLKLHPKGGLSENQRRALNQLASRASWNGGGPVDISIVTANAPDAVRGGYAVRDYLTAHQVSAHVIAYTTSQSQPADVISLITTEYRADVPDCNRQWENLSKSAQNLAPVNFGCAINANLAAQIDDPRDIAAPQPATPGDTGRKTTIIEKYRKGEVTSAAQDDAAKTTISSVIK
ncbi:MAG: CpaD family pilus assembly protein [Asticcacaulis sp.]